MVIKISGMLFKNESDVIDYYHELCSDYERAKDRNDTPCIESYFKEKVEFEQEANEQFIDLDDLAPGDYEIIEEDF